MGESIRATKSGFAAEAQKKTNAKYDAELAGQLLVWVKELTGADINTSGDRQNFFEMLKDGQVLCRLINSFVPETIPEKKINKSKMAFKCMENIDYFIKYAKEFGVPTIETFQAIDLWEMQNLTSVLYCLQSLARKAPKYDKPGFGPKEADKNIRNFSEEQINASNAVIGAQYGAFKGANQAGINFGNTRHM